MQSFQGRKITLYFGKMRVENGFYTSLNAVICFLVKSVHCYVISKENVENNHVQITSSWCTAIVSQPVLRAIYGNHGF